MTIRIGIIGHFALVREALKDLLSRRDGFSVVEVIGCDKKALGSAEKWKADLLILDLLQDKFIGRSIVRELKKRVPASKILVLSDAANGNFILDLFGAGASGFCLSSDPFTDVCSAIQNILSGQYYLSAPAQDQFVRATLSHRNTTLYHRPNPALTVRENEILKLIGEGHRTKAIAGMLYLSSRTVEKHRYNIMKKLNIHSAPDLVFYQKEKTGLLI